MSLVVHLSIKQIMYIYIGVMTSIAMLVVFVHMQEPVSCVSPQLIIYGKLSTIKIHNSTEIKLYYQMVLR